MITALTITPLRVPQADSPIYIYNVEVESQPEGVWCETLHESQIEPFLRGLRAGATAAGHAFVPMLAPCPERTVRQEYTDRGLPKPDPHV